MSRVFDPLDSPRGQNPDRSGGCLVAVMIALVALLAIAGLLLLVGSSFCGPQAINCAG